MARKADFPTPEQRILDRLPRRHPEAETPPMIIKDISHILSGKMRAIETVGILSQPSARFILRMLAHEDGVRQSDIAHAMHLSAPTVSITLKRMEEEGLIRRESYFQDLRAVKVYLTNKGITADKNVRRQMNEIFDDAMRDFSTDDVIHLAVLLQRMRNNLLESDADSSASENASASSIDMESEVFDIENDTDADSDT